MYNSDEEGARFAAGIPIFKIIFSRTRSRRPDPFTGLVVTAPRTSTSYTQGVLCDTIVRNLCVGGYQLADVSNLEIVDYKFMHALSLDVHLAPPLLPPLGCAEVGTTAHEIHGS